MASLKEIRGISDKVKHLLTNHPHLRDCDQKLTANIWHSEVNCASAISARTFLKYLSEGRLTSQDSITRARRKLQEENIELRGNKYKARQTEENNVRQNINS